MLGYFKITNTLTSFSFTSVFLQPYLTPDDMNTPYQHEYNEGLYMPHQPQYNMHMMQNMQMMHPMHMMQQNAQMMQHPMPMASGVKIPLLEVSRLD